MGKDFWEKMKILPKDLLKYLESDKNRAKFWLENYKKLINQDKYTWKEKFEKNTLQDNLTEEKRILEMLGVNLSTTEILEKNHQSEKTYQFSIPVLKRRFPVYSKYLSSSERVYIPLDYTLFENMKRTFVFIYHNGVKYLKLVQGFCIVIEIEYPENPVVAELDMNEPPLLKLQLEKEGPIDLRVEIGQC